MSMPFLEGYALGLALIVLIGPVLFVLLQSTLERGRAPGFAVALGILVSDILAVLLLSLGAAQLLSQPEAQSWLGIAGGLMLLSFGLLYLLRAPARAAPEQRGLGARSLAGFFAKGFLVNFVNPFVFLVWLGIIAAGTSVHGDGAELAWFLTGTIAGIFTLDSLKVLLADRLRPLLEPAALRVAFRLSGVLLLAFGARLLAM